MKDFSLISDNSDEFLQTRAMSGDRLAEEKLAMRYSRLVRMCARPYFLAGGDSEDLTQEGMLGLLSAIREYDPMAGASFKTYAEVCITRRLISAVKSSLRLKHTPLNEGISLDEFLTDETAAKTGYFPKAFRRIPEEQVLARESAAEIIQTYSRLLSRFEAQILKLFLDGLSYREIADCVNRPQKSVDNAVQRIRKKLAQNLYPGDIS